LVGTTEGVYRSDDLGASWQEASAGLAVRYIRWLAYHPDISDFEFAGTEPAAIFISRDGGENWRGCPEVAELRDEHRWSLPYSPGAGCVRGFAFNGQRGYAAVEDGSVLVSDDGGEHWRLAAGSRGGADHRPAAGFIHSDVHSIETHPLSPDLVFAPTGGGLYRSVDGGASWVSILPGTYCRAVWVDPRDPNHLVSGPAEGVDTNGRIEMTLNGGASWQQASTGLNTPWRHTMVERFLPIGDDLLAVLSDGKLLSAPLKTLAWRQILPEVEGVAAVGFMTIDGN
jgi:photosystem II stability/assembly factor-like uncharacterized protein